MKEETIKALIIVTNHSELGDTQKKTGYFLSEVTHPYFVLQKKGVEVDIASLKGGAAPMDPGSKDMNDELNKEFVENPEHYSKVQETLKLEELNPKDYQAIIFAGGHGTMWDFPESQTFSEFSQAIYANEGVIGAVCHGPAALIGLKNKSGENFLKGKKVTGFSNQEEQAVELSKVVPFSLEDQLKESGFDYHSADKFKNHVIVDGRLVTGQNPSSAKEMGEKILELLHK